MGILGTRLWSLLLIWPLIDDSVLDTTYVGFCGLLSYSLLIHDSFLDENNHNESLDLFSHRWLKLNGGIHH